MSRFRPVFPLLIVLALVAMPAGPTGQQQFTVFASIVDVTGYPVETLEPEDIRVTENDADAKVVKVEPIDWPTKLQILVDTGIGLGGTNFIHLRNGLRGLIEALPPGIEVTLVATAPQPRFLVRGTADREAIMKGLALLATESGAGRFVESLNEATQRIERDKGNYFPIIITMATNAGDLNVMERDVERIIKRLEQRPTTVHVVLFSGGAGSTIGGGNQTQVGLGVTNFTRGRYENINSGTRIATLLPELGAQVAKSHDLQSHQFRITVQRPAGASGPVGNVRLGAGASVNVASLSFDGLIPRP
jgi:hypothetical protein